jgi:cyclopropane fatty-acyl-phospholipid synthase-like methyltransferase|tara:strand:+ start:2716 stop:3330 length:615 start_codon:yes stop_codon:yes gene_type:complete
MNNDLKNHWENIYSNKAENEVSWFQTVPKTSHQLINKLNLESNDNIIDIGSGRSRILKILIDEGFNNISYLDISKEACEKSKIALGDDKSKVTWNVENVLSFKPKMKYKLWHDRAVFHFFTNKKDIEKYKEVATKNISDGGYLVLGTFSINGPKKCSGLDVSQYSEQSLNEIFKSDFNLLDSFYIDHQTPFDTTQNFLFCIFKK